MVSIGGYAEELRPRELWVPSENLQAVWKGDARAVVLSAEQYQRLLLDLAQVQAEEEQAANVIAPPVQASVQSAHYKGIIEPESEAVSFVADFVVRALDSEEKDGRWVEVPLHLPSAHLGSIQVDGESAVRVISHKKGRSMVLLMRSGEEQRVEVRFQLPVVRSSTGNSFSLPSPKAPVASLTLELPADATLETALPYVRKEGENTARFALPAMTKNSVHEIHWSAQKVAAIPGAAVLQNCSYIFSLDSTSLTADLGFVLSTSLRDLPNELTIEMPADTEVLSVEGEELLSWSREGKGAIQVVFLPGARDAADIRILAEKKISLRDELDLSLPFPIVKGVHRASGTFSVLGGNDVRVKGIETNSLMAPIPDDEEGGLQQHANYITSFRFPLLSETPRVRLSAVEPRYKTQMDTLIRLDREAVFIDRTLQFALLEGDVFEIEVVLPASEEIIGVESEGAFSWREIQSGEGEGEARRVALTWQGGLGQIDAATVRMYTRRDPVGWYELGAEPRDLNYSQATVLDAETTSGYVAVRFADQFLVETVTSSGLESRDSRVTPIQGNLAWFRLEEFDLLLRASRRQAEVRAEIVGYALPLSNSMEIEGQIELDILHSGIEELTVTAPEEVVSRIHFDSPLLGEKTLLDAQSAWRLQFHQELMGTVQIPFRIVLPLTLDEKAPDGESSKVEEAVEKRFGISMPQLSFPEAKRVGGIWVLEANTDTELHFEPKGIDAVDSLVVPALSHYQPRHRIIGAYRYRGNEWSLGISGTRHARATMVSTVVDHLRIDSVLSTDGNYKHQVQLRVRSSGEQFLEVALPGDSAVWSLVVDGQLSKPVRSSANQIRVRLPSEARGVRPVEIRLLYQTEGRSWAGAGRARLDPVTLDSAIPVLESDWVLHLPEGYDYQNIESNLGERFEVVDRVLLGELYNEIGEGVSNESRFLVAKQENIENSDQFYVPGSTFSVIPIPANAPSAPLIAPADEIDQVETKLGRVLREDSALQSASDFGFASGGVFVNPVSSEFPHAEIGGESFGEDYERNIRDFFSQSEKKEESVNHALGNLQLPVEIDLSGKTLGQCVSILNSEIIAVEASGHSAGVPKIEILDTGTDGAPRGESEATESLIVSSLRLGKSNVLEVLDRMTGATNTHYRVTSGGVLIAPREVSMEPMASLSISMPNTEFQSVSDDGVVKQLHARNVLMDQGVLFPPGSGAAYNHGAGRLAVKNTEANLKKVADLYEKYLRPDSSDPLAGVGGAQRLKGFRPGDVGRLPLAFRLPQSGRAYHFRGLYSPTTIDFRYVNWERQMRWAWVWIFVGATVFWWGHRRFREKGKEMLSIRSRESLRGALGRFAYGSRTGDRKERFQAVFVGLLGIVLLSFIPLVLSASFSHLCNALLTGWLFAFGVWILKEIAVWTSKGGLAK